MKNSLIRLELNCNQKCLFCTYGDVDRKTMTTNEAKIRIDESIKNGADSLDFTGGEPTIRNDIEELIAYTNKSQLKRIGLQTNGVKLSDFEFLKRLKKNGLNYLTLSFHSHIEETYNQLTSTNHYKKSVLAIKNIKKLNINYSVVHVVNSLNYDKLIDFVDFIKEYNPTLIHFSLIRPNGRTQENIWLVPRLKKIKKYIIEVMDYCDEGNYPYIFDGMPLCYLGKHFKKSGDYYRSQTLEKEFRFYGKDSKKSSDLSNSNLKVKSKRCSFCKFNKNCAGIWEEYAEIYGVSELKPIKN